jgi:hypothetical protein
MVERVEFDARFISTTAPAGVRIPLSEAVGTAVNPSVALCVGITMLVVAPGSAIDPLMDSVVVFTTSTLLLPESKTITVARFADISMSPGAFKLPAPIPATRGSVSSKASTIVRLPNVDPAVTLCEARTRVSRPLGGSFALGVVLQEIRQMLATKRTPGSRTDFFKREAPNDMKNGDLNAK